MNPSLTTVSPSSKQPSASFSTRQVGSGTVSSSVPNGTLASRMSRTPSGGKAMANGNASGPGPRMSTFSIPPTAQGVTQVRPGLLAHATSTSPVPSSVPVQLSTFPPAQHPSFSGMANANANGVTTKVFAGAGMTVSPYADEELASADEASESGDEAERIKVEPVDTPMSGLAKAQPMAAFASSNNHASNTNGFDSYRDSHSGFNGAYSVSIDSSTGTGPLPLGAHGASANTTTTTSGSAWSSSLPRSDMREDSLSASGRSRSVDEEASPRSRSRSRSNSAEFGGGGYGRFEYGYRGDGGDMDVVYEHGDGRGHGHEGMRVGKGVRKERVREGEEEEGWVDMDMDVSRLFFSFAEVLAHKFGLG